MPHFLADFFTPQGPHHPTNQHSPPRLAHRLIPFISAIGSGKVNPLIDLTSFPIANSDRTQMMEWKWNHMAMLSAAMGSIYKVDLRMRPKSFGYGRFFTS